MCVKFCGSRLLYQSLFALAREAMRWAGRCSSAVRGAEARDAEGLPLTAETEEQDGREAVGMGAWSAEGVGGGVVDVYEVRGGLGDAMRAALLAVSPSIRNMNSLLRWIMKPACVHTFMGKHVHCCCPTSARGLKHGWYARRAVRNGVSFNTNNFVNDYPSKAP